MMNPAEFANIAKAEQHFWWYRGMRQIMFGLLDPYVSKRQVHRILDAGCGTGYFAKLVEQRYEAPTYVIDYGWPGLGYARRMGVHRAAQGDVRALPFASGVFDLLLSMDVVVHLPRGEESEAIREMARVLGGQGLLAIRVAALDILRSRHSQFAQERQRFTRRRLIRAVEAQGLRVLRCSYVNSLLSPVAFAKFRIWEPLAKRPPASGVGPVAPWLDKTLHVPLSIEARLLRSGWNLPFGQSLVLIAEKPPTPPGLLALATR